MDVFKKEDLVLETCDPPEIIEMTESEKAYEAMICRFLFDMRSYKMHDFTKEELEVIHYCFENISHRKFMADIRIQPLYLKIRSMIENYCEHENTSSIHPGDTVLICNKCETILSHWNLREA